MNFAGKSENNTIVNESASLSDAEVGANLIIASTAHLGGESGYITATRSGGSLINNGAIDFYSANSTPAVQSLNGFAGLTNNGSILVRNQASFTPTNLVNASGKTVSLGTAGQLTLIGDDWDNNGTINIGASATLRLAGNFATADLGTINRSSPNDRLPIQILGTLQNTGSTLTMTATTTGNIGLTDSAVIIGGTIDSDDGVARIVTPGSGELRDNVTLEAPVTVDGGHTLRIRDGITINSVVSLGNASPTFTPGRIQFVGTADVFVDGFGFIFGVGPNSGNVVSTINNDIVHVNDSAGEVVFGPTLSVSGTLSVLGQSTNNAIAPGELASAVDPLQPTYVNFGTISSPVGAQMTLGDGSALITNEGFIDAAGSTITAIDLVNGFGGQITLTNFGSIALSGDNWTNQGSISLTGNALLALGGSFEQADIGIVDRDTSSTISIFGTLDNIGKTFTLGDTFGDVYLDAGGFIDGGTIAATNGHRLIVGGGLLHGVTLNADALVADDNGLYILDGLTLNGTLTLGRGGGTPSGGALIFFGNTDDFLAGTGHINVVGPALSVIRNELENYDEELELDLGQRVTIGSGISITVAGGQLQMESTVDGGVIANAGIIHVLDAPTGIFTVSGSFENSGTLTLGAGSSSVIVSLQNTLGTVTLGAGARFEIRFGEYAIDGPVSIGNDAVAYFGGTFTKSAAASMDVGGTAIFNNVDVATYNDLYGQVITGRNGGAWNGTGIRSTRSAATSRTLGAVRDNQAVLGVGNTFAGFAITPATSLIVRYTQPGDLDLSGTVNFADLLRLAQNYGVNSGATYGQGDTDYSGTVNFADLLTLAQRYGTSLSIAPAAAAATLPSESAQPGKAARRTTAADIVG